MREMMQKLNVVKYAASEEQKKELLAKGFLPVKGKKPDKGSGKEAQQTPAKGGSDG